ncbi:hypothetical protein BKA63DRAFT_41026 [Paraphoma chrysanthemicola]|nr:hypothetical protein BKA63DRAFT_41026 [Paraphoma chrysanthemicola]
MKPCSRYFLLDFYLFGMDILWFDACCLVTSISISFEIPFQYSSYHALDRCLLPARVCALIARKAVSLPGVMLGYYYHYYYLYILRCVAHQAFLKNVVLMA